MGFDKILDQFAGITEEDKKIIKEIDENPEKERKLAIKEEKEREIIIEQNKVKEAYFKSKEEEYKHDSNLADKLYKAYVTNGVSRIEKVNGRFLASQTLKLDILIQQNNEIIKLLKKIAEKE